VRPTSFNGTGTQSDAAAVPGTWTGPHHSLLSTSETRPVRANQQLTELEPVRAT
jgi:hypothetical protein